MADELKTTEARLLWQKGARRVVLAQRYDGTAFDCPGDPACWKMRPVAEEMERDALGGESWRSPRDMEHERDILRAAVIDLTQHAKSET